MYKWNHTTLSYLDVTAGRDQQRVVWGEVKVSHPAAVERVHGIFAIPRTNLQQRAILDTPDLLVDSHILINVKYVSYWLTTNKGAGKINTFCTSYSLYRQLEFAQMETSMEFWSCSNRWLCTGGGESQHLSLLLDFSKIRSHITNQIVSMATMQGYEFMKFMMKLSGYSVIKKEMKLVCRHTVWI